MRPMSRAAVLALIGLAALSSSAHAQTIPPPPAAYAAASIGLDLVLEPLVSAAEADLGRGEPAMALARAQVVLAEAPASSTVHVRAEGLSLVAQQRLVAPPGSVTSDDAYAPMLDAATADTAAGRFDLARARLAWVDAHAPAGSALVLRASTVRAALDARVTSASVATAPPPTTSAWTTPVPTWTAVATPTPPASSDPRRRTDLEIADLYVTGGLMGAYLGAWMSQSTGWLDGHSSEDASRITAIAMIAGAGVLTLGVFGYDQIDRGPRMGQPGTIAQGIRFGFVLSGLSLGVMSADAGCCRVRETFDAMGIGVLGGAALGTLFAYTLEPHPAQVQFTQSVGVWGALLGAELAALATPLSFPSGNRDSVRMGFGLTLGGLSTGILVGFLLSAAHENFSARRSWLTTAGLVAGSGAGTLIWTLISLGGHGNFDVPTWGACAGVGGIAGLILVGVLTAGDHGPRDWDEAPDVQLSIAPTMGGATLGLDGTF